jgi:hypothetical protein
MRMTALAAAACAVFATAALAGPFDQFKGKMKEGMYEYKMTMDMGAVPGMPPGMGKQNFSFQRCVTPKDVEEGAFSKGREGKGMENCEVKDFNMSGNTATYKMECKGEGQMKADNKITFLPNGFDMDMKMSMVRNGQPMNMTQHMEGRNLGPCK